MTNLERSLEVAIDGTKILTKSLFLKLKSLHLKNFEIGRYSQRLQTLTFHFLSINMKTAQELRVGNVVMINNTPMVILKSEYSKGGRGASTVKLKMKNLLSNGGTENCLSC